jgi:hypothetical protein
LVVVHRIWDHLEGLRESFFYSFRPRSLTLAR